MDNVRVQHTVKGFGVFANQDLQPGQIVVVGRPIREVPERTIHSLQMDFDKHVDLDEPGRLINHSCAPNTGVRNNALGGYDFIALQKILSGDEITFDYETTEYISIAVPQCLCGASNCRGQTRGFRFLPLQEQKKYGEFIADYLKRAADFP